MNKEQASKLRAEATKLYDTGGITYEELGKRLTLITLKFREANKIQVPTGKRKGYGSANAIRGKVDEYKLLKRDEFADWEIAEFWDVSTTTLWEVKKTWKEKGVL